nr:MAG TPA: protein of unknown function (DUF4376) [Caudoviricetes sp.]
MNLIKITALPSGAHENRNTPWETTVPEGWAIIPENMKIPESFPFVDIEVKEIEGVQTVVGMTGHEIVVNEEEVKAKVAEAAKVKVAESKTALSEYLAAHPLQWTDGKYYSVTSEKQALLTSNLSLYQLAVSNGQPFKLTWNSTGDECVEWVYKELASLALAIGTYVKPFVARQQELELDIKACTTMEELDAIEINYDPVLEQYLKTAGQKEVAE